MARKPSFFLVSKYLASRKAQVRAVRAEIKRAEENSDELALGAAECNAVARVAALHGEVKYSHMSVWSGYALELTCSFEVPCTSLTSGVIPEVLNAALNYGFEADADSSYDSVGQYEATRVYGFSKTIGKVRVYLKVRANVKDAEGATCRKVQVGTKIEQVPQYELVCE